MTGKVGLSSFSFLYSTLQGDQDFSSVLSQSYIHVDVWWYELALCHLSPRPPCLYKHGRTMSSRGQHRKSGDHSKILLSRERGGSYS